LVFSAKKSAGINSTPEPKTGSNNERSQQKNCSDNMLLDPQRTYNNSEEAKATHGSIGKWSSPAKRTKVRNDLGATTDAATVE